MNKHINSFDTVADYNGYISSDKAFFPNVAHVSGETRVRILDEAPESPYEMRFFTHDPEEPIDTDRFQFEIGQTYDIKLYDKDNDDFVSTDDWYPEIAYDNTEVRTESSPKVSAYVFSVDVNADVDVNFKAIVDRQTVDEREYHFISPM